MPPIIHAPQLILDFATVLGVAAVTTLLCRWLKQPAVLGYLLAGLIVGPHVPVPLVADPGNVETLAELGVVLLLFSVGLEFDLRKLLRKGPSALVMGGLQLGTTAWLGYLTGQALGWPVQESALTGAALAISSTMIISKLFEEQSARGPLRDGVLSVLVVQDLVAILLLAGLGAVSATGQVHAPGLAWALAKVLLFLVLLLGAGGLVVPRLLRWAADHGRDETLLVATVGVCFSAAVLAAKTGCSMALGAFLAGMLAAGSGRVRAMERLVLPLRDMFAAIFFVAVGMKLAPQALLHQAGPILALSAVVLLGNSLATTLGALLAGLPLQRGLRTGLALAQPGEFSFVVVGLGIQAGLLPERALPVAVGVCLVTALTGPVWFRRGPALAEALEQTLPTRLRCYLATYQGWSAKLGRSSLGRGPSPVRGSLLFLLLDAILISGCVIGTSLLRQHLPWLRGGSAGHALLTLALSAVALLAWAMHRRAGAIAAQILDSPGPAVLVGRRPLLATLRAALLLCLGAPTLAILQPFLPEGPILLLLLAALGTLLGLLWVQTRGLPWEQASGSEWLLGRVKAPWTRPADRSSQAPGLVSWRLDPHSPFLGRSLAELLDTGGPGLSVLAMVRAGQALAPDPEQRLQVGDLLALSGPSEALDRLRAT